MEQNNTLRYNKAEQYDKQAGSRSLNAWVGTIKQIIRTKQNTAIFLFVFAFFSSWIHKLRNLNIEANGALNAAVVNHNIAKDVHKLSC